MYRYQIMALLLAFLVIVAVACTEAPEGPKASVKVEVKSPAQEDDKAPITVDKDDLKALVQGNNEFAFDLYQRLSQEKGNIVFSPHSISTALAMIYGGAQGKTAEEMAKTLHFTLPQGRFHPANRELIAALQQNEEKHAPYHLRTANALWGQKGYDFKEDFLQLTRKNYGAGLKEVDFGNAEEARATINRWVAEQTKDKIKELLEKGKVNSQTCLVLANVIYFKANWKAPFLKGETKDADFEVSPSQRVSVPMMISSKNEVFNSYTGDGFQLVELPYLGDRLTMVVLLPQQRAGLENLEKRLTAATLKEGLDKLKLHMGQVALPRFKVNAYNPLAQDLQEMGMPLAFSNAADFSGIGRGLRISSVEHKAYIDVDEVGTEAAAATAVDMVGSALPSLALRADHPFLFFVRDRHSGVILFMGRVTDPSHHTNNR